MQVYAQQAKDRELTDHATEIRMRAEICAGELLREMERTRERVVVVTQKLAAGPVVAKRYRPVDTAPKLSDLGVTKDQSSRWQKLAGIPGTSWMKSFGQRGHATICRR